MRRLRVLILGALCVVPSVLQAQYRSPDGVQRSRRDESRAVGRFSGGLAVNYGRPVGEFYEKPGMDKVFTKEDEESNEGYMRAKKVWGATIPKPRTIHIAALDYGT